MKKNYVFTYGTLLKEERNHHFLSDDDFVCEAFIKGYKMFDLGRYPGIETGDGIVSGELYFVDDESLKRLDYLEDEGDLYIRKTTKVYTLNEVYEAYVYVYNHSVNNPIYLGSETYSWKFKNGR